MDVITDFLKTDKVDIDKPHIDSKQYQFERRRKHDKSCKIFAINNFNHDEISLSIAL